jgi:tetratricopeptide (TPR) repeat protein
MRLHDEDVEREPEVVAALFRVAILTRLMLPTGEGSVPLVEDALKIGKDALERQKKFVAAHQEVTQYKRDLAASYHNVGWLTHRLDRSEEALSYLNAARRIREELCESQETNLDYQSELAGVLNDIGLAWYRVAQLKDDRAFREVLSAVSSGLVWHGPDRPGDAHAYYATAEQVFRSALDRQRRAAKDAPHVLRYRILLASHRFNLAKLVGELGRGANALSLVEEMLSAQPDDPEVMVRAARILVLVAEATTDEAAKETHLAQAVKLASRAYLETPSRPSYGPLNNNELKRIQDRPDFKKLLAKVAARP